jgi:hypothetical protein
VVAAGSYPPSPTLGTAAGQVPLTTRPRWQFAVALGSVVGAIAVGLLLVMSLSKPTPQPVAPPPPRPAMPKSEPPPVVKVVHYTVDSQPTGAAVVRLRDGQLLGQTPLSLTSPRNSVPEQLRVSLPGYVEESVAIDLRQDSEQKLELRRKGGRDSKRSKNPKSDTHAKGYVHGDLTVVD